MQIIRPQQAADKLGMGLSTLWYKARKDPDFPQPIKLTDGITGFLASELDAYIEGRVAAFRRQPERKDSAIKAASASLAKRTERVGGRHD